jgi:hypothetical protein
LKFSSECGSEKEKEKKKSVQINFKEKYMFENNLMSAKKSQTTITSESTGRKGPPQPPAPPKGDNPPKTPPDTNGEFFL